MKRSIIAAAVLVVLSGGALAADAPAYVAAAVADATRPKDDVAADVLRFPAETIAFAGVKTGMVVGELFPGGGYFTRMLSDVVGPHGKIYGIENTGWKGAVEADQKTIAELKTANVTLDPESFGHFTLPQKVDVFWITQNYHDLHIAKYGAVDLADFNHRVFEALKPGGTYFILDHEANAGTTADQIAVLHRIEKAQVIREVTAAGFKLVAEGDFLHRTTDDHTKPIFDASVQGHTDQYALKFVKPR